MRENSTPRYSDGRSGIFHGRFLREHSIAKSFYWNFPIWKDIYDIPRTFQVPSSGIFRLSVGIFLEGFENMLCYLGIEISILNILKVSILKG